MLDVPVIDIEAFRSGSEADRADLIGMVAQTCREIGFLIIAGHQVPSELVEDHRAICRAFFELADEQKLTVLRAGIGSPGYIPLQAHALAQTRGGHSVPDLKESYSIGPLDATDDPYYTGPAAAGWFHPNSWPDAPSGFQELWTQYYRHMERLADTVLHIFATALRLPGSYFEDKFDHHVSRLASVHYPGLDQPPDPAQLRAGAHSDYGALTILSKPTAEPGAGGLQVQNKLGEWRDVDPPPGCFVVNLGDLMARWTNDTWVSTVHRVVVPASHFARQASLSTVYFHMPNYDATIATPPACLANGKSRYEPISAGDYLAEKYRQQEAAVANDKAVRQ